MLKPLWVFGSVAPPEAHTVVFQPNWTQQGLFHRHENFQQYDPRKCINVGYIICPHSVIKRCFAVFLNKLSNTLCHITWRSSRHQEINMSVLSIHLSLRNICRKKIIKPLDCDQKEKYPKRIPYFGFSFFPCNPPPTTAENNETKFFIPMQINRLIIYLSLIALGLCCCVQAFL